MINQSHPNIRKIVFWDTYFNDIDWNKNAGFIITRVYEKGSIDELKEIHEFYGNEKIKHELINARYLSNRILNYASIVFNTKKSKFKCYSKTL
ncbi:MAG: hypothetical protein ABFR62_10230 [Bacteroidota bacterium]